MDHCSVFEPVDPARPAEPGLYRRTTKSLSYSE
jgi:hypothetical protein